MKPRLTSRPAMRSRDKTGRITSPSSDQRSPLRDNRCQGENTIANCLSSPSPTASCLAIFGGADPGIPPSAVEEFDRALTRAGVARESVTYDGAPHSFFDRRQTEFADASADAWRRVQAFVKAHS